MPVHHEAGVDRSWMTLEALSRVGSNSPPWGLDSTTVSSRLPCVPLRLAVRTVMRNGSAALLSSTTVPVVAPVRSPAPPALTAVQVQVQRPVSTSVRRTSNTMDEPSTPLTTVRWTLSTGVRGTNTYGS